MRVDLYGIDWASDTRTLLAQVLVASPTTVRVTADNPIWHQRFQKPIALDDGTTIAPTSAAAYVRAIASKYCGSYVDAVFTDSATA